PGNRRARTSFSSTTLVATLPPRFAHPVRGASKLYRRKTESNGGIGQPENGKKNNELAGSPTGGRRAPCLHPHAAWACGRPDGTSHGQVSAPRVSRPSLRGPPLRR